MKTECYYYSCRKTGKIIGRINDEIKVAYCEIHIERGTRLFENLMTPNQPRPAPLRSRELKDATRLWDTTNLRLPSWYVKPNWNQPKK